MKVVAWRGNSHKHLENTYEAIRDTPDWVSLIEIDTRLSGDGSIMAYHSPTMRVHGDPRNFCDIPDEEVSGKMLYFKKRGYQIPMVLNLLDDFPEKEFLFHIKRESDVEKYVREVDLFPRPCYFHSNSEPHLEALIGHPNNKGTFKSVYKVPEPAVVLDHVHGYMCGHRAFMPVSALEDWWLSALRECGKEILVFASMSQAWMEEVVQFDVDGFLTGRFDRAATVMEGLNGS